MPRPTARRPAPIVLPNCPMDTLWEVDEMSDAPRPPAARPTPQRSVFEDDDEREQLRNVSFPLPPVALPRKRFFAPRMTLPIHPPPKQIPAVLSSPPRRSPSKYSLPIRAPAFPRVPSPIRPRPASPTSSASSSDTEPPRTPPAAPASLPSSRKPSYILAPPPPAEWESAIDALYEFADDQDEILSVPAPSSAPRTLPVPTRPAPRPPKVRDSQMTWSPEDPCARLSFMCMAPEPSPLPLSMAVYATDALPMSPTFNRPLTSPGFMPTSPTSPVAYDLPLRPARSSRRMGQYMSIPVQLSRA